MLELFQTEWCPASRRVRERMTELGLDYVVHQVPVERSERILLKEVTGADTIPALVVEDGAVVVGEEAIRAYLERRFDEPTGAEAHRVKAAKAHRRRLEEECRCSELQSSTR
jgi:glutathione S-transferase